MEKRSVIVAILFVPVAFILSTGFAFGDMGNRVSTRAIPVTNYAYQSDTSAKKKISKEKEEEEDKTVFSIFSIAAKIETSYNQQPLGPVSTREYNPLFQIAFSTGQVKNIGLKHDLEDLLYVNEMKRNNDSIFFASVLDGHSGMETALFVEQHLFKALGDALFDNPEDIKGEVKRIFQEVDATYCEEKAPYVKKLFNATEKSNSCCRRPQPTLDRSIQISSGCVMVMICIHNNKLILTSLGDCGIVFSSNGRACFSLAKHSPMDEVERQRILLHDGKIIENRVGNALDVSRSFGDVALKPSYFENKKKYPSPSCDWILAEPDVVIQPLSSDLEFCIIGSDGLFSYISYQNAVNIVKKTIQRGQSGEDACNELINRARLKKSYDDITVAILFFHISNHDKTLLVVTDAVDLAKDPSPSDHVPSDHSIAEEANSPVLPMVARSTSDCNLSIYSTKKSIRESTIMSVQNIFSRTDYEEEDYRGVAPGANNNENSMGQRPVRLSAGKECSIELTRTRS